MKYLSYIPILCIALLFMACSDDEVTRTVPWREVSFKINLKHQDPELNNPGSFKIYTTPRIGSDRIGYGGLLVVSSIIPANDGTPIMIAYDLACPYEDSPTLRVNPSNDGKAKCSQCNSVYDIYTGGGRVLSGPSKENLQVYRSVSERPYDGVFYIYN